MTEPPAELALDHLVVGKIDCLERPAFDVAVPPADGALVPVSVSPFPLAEWALGALVITDVHPICESLLEATVPPTHGAVLILVQSAASAERTLDAFVFSYINLLRVFTRHECVAATGGTHVIGAPRSISLADWTRDLIPLTEKVVSRFRHQVGLVCSRSFGDLDF
jgi:hypothetical protein